MAVTQKKITDLQLRSDVVDTVNFPCDDGIQSYRVTALQILNYILPAGAITVAKLATDAVETVKIKALNVTLGKLEQTVQNALVPTGSVLPFAGTSVPTGYLFCDGSAVSRSTYATLFAALSTNHGTGDGSTTFNLPDYRGQFLRGRIGIANVTGSGSAASNNATFTAHGYNHTGVRVRLSSGTLSGLTTSTDYYVIWIDANTLAFATSLANAYAGTKITLSGANSAVIVQSVDPAATTRTASSTGGTSGDNVGSSQTDAMQGHYHGLEGGGLSLAAGAAGRNVDNTGNALSARATSPITDGTNGTPRTDRETRPTNVYVNYMIKT